MDIKKTIDEVTAKIKNDPKLLEKFTEDPVKALESMTGLDLPDDAVKPVAEGIKAKLKGSDILGKIGDLKKLF
jgi:hypothetical protein